MEENIKTMKPNGKELINKILAIKSKEDDYNYLVTLVRLESMTHTELWFEYNLLKLQRLGRIKINLDYFLSKDKVPEQTFKYE
jgi:hypothetical protein